ncbi:hypothetical protein BJ138DRAFT_646753 [Hygrophoropsis aurantiaca]|uniref:Uncharacterized protein n=1 Tax=Hygrophoropsis aurantiaca TaxID=72124 RepID=A0ACB8AK19_9AGAM|nr:hypothetical protein BJ138DRAFT_646753 [Hygrophoropsis aurantiaca]
MLLKLIGLVSLSLSTRYLFTQETATLASLQTRSPINPFGVLYATSQYFKAFTLVQALQTNNDKIYKAEFNPYSNTHRK